MLTADALKVISHAGMPSFRHHELGDLYVRISVKFPENLDPSVIPALESALPPRLAIQKQGKHVHVDEVTLEEPNDRQKRSAASGGDDMDEDDDDGRPGVQCAQRESREYGRWSELIFQSKQVNSFYPAMSALAQFTSRLLPPFRPARQFERG